MIQLELSSNFEKKLKKLTNKNRELLEKVHSTIILFQEFPHHSFLKTHKLKGKLSHLWSFSVEDDLRITYSWLDDKTALLERIGRHDEIYRQ